jgi:hypothetical protein
MAQTCTQLHIDILMASIWLIRNDDLHGRDRQQREKKRIKKLTPKVVALYAKADTLLAADKDIFEIPIQTCLTFPSGELSTWIKLVTPTVYRAIANANAFLHLTNNTITPHLVHRPDPMTLDKHVNELRPVSRMPPYTADTPNITVTILPVAMHSGLPIMRLPLLRVYLGHRSPARGW